MPNRDIQVARDRIVLGTLSESDARQLLEVGFLRPTDIFLVEEATEWKALDELNAHGPPQAKPGRWLDRAKTSASNVATAISGSATTVTTRIKKLAAVKKVATTEAVSAALEGYVPQIKRILSQLADTRPIQAVRSGVRDDDLMRKIFGAAYDCLPRPVCRFINEERFIGFCMQHKQRLLDS